MLFQLIVQFKEPAPLKQQMHPKVFTVKLYPTTQKLKQHNPGIPDTSLLCPYSRWGPSISKEGSGFWAEIRTSISQCNSCESSLYGQVFVKEDKERTSTSRAQVSPPSLPEYLYPPLEHKSSCTDLQHRVSCCLCRCHCSFVFPSIRRLEGRKMMATHHSYPQTLYSYRHSIQVSC